MCYIVVMLENMMLKYIQAAADLIKWVVTSNVKFNVINDIPCLSLAWFISFTLFE